MAYQRTPKTPITVRELKEAELYGVLLRALGEAQPLDDSVLEQKLAAAEDYYERELQIRFQPSRVFSDVWARQNQTFPPGTLDLPADYDRLRDIDEPAYDYHVSFFDYGRWGEIALSHRPVRDVTRLAFAFPGVGVVYEPPKNWIRIGDRKFGLLQLVPSSGEAILAVFYHFVFQKSVGSRGTLPQSIFIDYTVGFDADELCANHQDLLEGVRLRALLLAAGIITTIAVPRGQTSSSLSLDGLSHSRSFGGKYGPYSGKIQLAIEQEQQIMDSWRRREKGVRVAFA